MLPCLIIVLSIISEIVDMGCCELNARFSLLSYVEHTI